MSEDCQVISVHGPHALSGVTTWAGRMAGMDGPLRHRMLVVRRASDPVVGPGFPGFGTPGYRVITLDEDASVSDEVLAIAAVFRETIPAISLVHDHVPAAIAAGIVDRSDLAIASISHADEPRYADLFERIGPMLDVWWGDSEAARRRAVNPACADVCAGAFPGGAPRVPDGDLPPRVFDSASPARLLWLGRVERYQKRVLDAVELMTLLSAMGTPATMTIAGDGPALGEVRARIGSMGISDCCRAIGAVSLDDVPGLLASHDALVMTSAFEGTPVAAAEAAHRGLALILTDRCGGLLDLAEPGDVVVTVCGQPDEQAAAVDRAVKAEGAMESLGRAARGLARSKLDQAKIRIGMDTALREGFARRAARSDDAASRSSRWSSILSVLDMLEGVTQPDVERLLAAFCEGRGVAVDENGLSASLPGLPRLNERLIAEAVAVLREQGILRIALYGAGHHTVSAERVIRETEEIVAIVDDRTDRCSSIGGIPIVTPSDPMMNDVEAVIVSSSEYEDELARRASEWARERPVVRLYRPGFSAGVSADQIEALGVGS